MLRILCTFETYSLSASSPPKRLLAICCLVSLGTTTDEFTPRVQSIMENLVSFLSSLSQISRDYLRSVQEKQSVKNTGLVADLGEVHGEEPHKGCFSQKEKTENVDKQVASKEECYGKVPIHPNHLKNNLLSSQYEKSLKCQLHARKFSSKQEFLNHKDGVHSNVVGTNIVCKVQEKESCKNNDLGDVYAGKPPEECESPKDTAYHAEKDFVFECCGRIFYYPSHVKRHQSTFLHQNSLKCYICGERFSSKDDLSNHEESVHSKIGTNFVCKLCSKLFRSKNILNNHIACVHSEERPFQCELCPFAAKRKDQIQRHFLRRHSGKPNEFICDTCGLSFESKSAISSHIQCVHARNREQCRKCFKTFSDKSDLDMHMKFHLPGKNFFCQVCGRAFKTFSHRERHLLVHFKPPSKRKLEKPKSCQNIESPKRKKSVHTRSSSKKRRKKNIYPNTQKVHQSKSDRIKCDDKGSAYIQVEETVDVDVESINEEFSYVDVEGLDDESIDASVYILPDQAENPLKGNPQMFPCSDHSSSMEKDIEGCGSAQGPHCIQNEPCSKPYLVASQLSNQSMLKLRSVSPPSKMRKRGGTCSTVSSLDSVADLCDQECLKEGISFPNIVNKEIAISTLSGDRSSSTEGSTSMKKEKHRRKRSQKLKEITLQERNVPKRLKTLNKLSVEFAPQCEINFDQDLKQNRTLNSVTCIDSFEQIPSSSSALEFDSNIEISCVPAILEENEQSSVTTCGSIPQRKCRERSMQHSKKNQNSKKNNKKDLHLGPRVYVTNVSDESDVFLLPEFFTEEDVENLLPSDEELPVVHPVNFHNSNDFASEELTSV